MEFEKSLDDILKIIPKERRTFLFSATMTDKVKKLQRACLRNPVKLKVSSKYSTVDTLREEFYLVPADDKVILPLLLSVHVINPFRVVHILGLYTIIIVLVYSYCKHISVIYHL